MMRLSVKACLALLWGMSALFSTESLNVPITEVSGVNSTAEPAETTKRLTTAHVAHDKTEPRPDATQRPPHKPAEDTAAATSDTTGYTSSPAVETEETTIAHRISNGNATGLVTTNTAAPAASSSGPRLPQTFAAATTAAGELSHSTTIAAPASTTASETAKPTESGGSLTTSSGTTAPATASATMPSSPQLTHTINPEVTSTSAAPNTTQDAVIIQAHGTPPASTMTANPTSDAAPAFDPTAVLFTTSQPPSPSTAASSTSQPGFETHHTSQLPDSAASSSTPAATTAAVSTSPAGILIPHVPKKGPIPTTRSTPASTAAPREVSNSQPDAEVQTCSTRSIATKCLIVIASLAALATIFMVCTIALCAKLSSRKYKVKRPQQATEMMCISSLLPERTYNYSRQRNPVNNGVLVIHTSGDSDEDERDNLTLSSFLPENDRLA